jgi:myo-inositol-1(or 4)-monophosphatase
VPTTPGPAALVDIAADACRSAARLVHDAAATQLDVRFKAHNDPVTNLDIRVEQHLRATLHAATPGSGILGEELPAAAGDSNLRWYVDPIDGTANFSRGVPLSAISVAAAVDGHVVAGCVYDLGRGECFTGGHGVPLRIDTSHPLPTAPPKPGADPIVVTDIPQPGHATPRQVAFLGELLNRAQLRRVYSTALSLAWVAAGRADAACNLVVSAWDVAAGAALVTAAGHRYLPVGDPEPLRDGAFVAAAADRPDLADWLVARLTDLAGT